MRFKYIMLRWHRPCLDNNDEVVKTFYVRSVLQGETNIIESKLLICFKSIVRNRAYVYIYMYIYICIYVFKPYCLCVCLLLSLFLYLCISLSLSLNVFLSHSFQAMLGWASLG